jgi:hypothetical protein
LILLAMANSKPVFNLKALGYALLWQSYWLPVLLIVAHDQWLQVRQLQPPDHPQQQPALPAPSQAKGQPPLASVLAVQSHSVDALPETPAQLTASQATTSLVTPAQVTALPRGNNPLSNATLEATSQPLRGLALVGQRTTKSLSGQTHGAQRHPSPRLTAQATALQLRIPAGRPNLPLVSGVDRTSPVLRQFSGSELLGGPLTLAQPSQEAMSPLARAEQARLMQTGDPLAPVPARWREPMRRELRDLGAARLSQARVVHVPSERITHKVVLPLAMQHDGSVDALVAKDPAVSDRDLSDWAARQATPAKGSVQPVVLHLHPLPKSAVTARVTLPAQAPAPGPAGVDAPPAKGSASPGGLP